MKERDSRTEKRMVRGLIVCYRGGGKIKKQDGKMNRGMGRGKEKG